MLYFVIAIIELVKIHVTYYASLLGTVHALYRPKAVFV